MAVGRTVPAATRPGSVRPRHPLQVLWAICLLVGLFLVGSFAYGMWKGVSEQQHLNQVWNGAVHPRSPVAQTVDPTLQQPVDGIDFAIQIPKLSYTAAVKEGVDGGVLYSGPGHYPTTMWPGNPGTVGVAAHNVYWINFPQLVKGDEVDIQTRYGLYRYQITGSEIVSPSDRTVLVPGAAGYHLTLTTCWPLWAGAFATQRYVIFATQVWPTAQQPGYGG
ncbi:MAG TPA: class D sortase [Candidatus Dormibacteraeota bacterium]|nr:class D sortase [Candidatus Dormibacteraeota bacterium]